MNIDQLNNSNLPEVTTAAFKLLDIVQGEKPGVQPLAVGLLFTLVCDAKGITAQRVLDVVSRLRRAHDEAIDQSQVRAIEQYIKEELK